MPEFLQFRTIYQSVITMIVFVTGESYIGVDAGEFNLGHGSPKDHPKLKHTVSGTE